MAVYVLTYQERVSIIRSYAREHAHTHAHTQVHAHVLYIIINNIIDLDSQKTINGGSIRYIFTGFGYFGSTLERKRNTVHESKTHGMYVL